MKPSQIAMVKQHRSKRMSQLGWGLLFVISLVTPFLAKISIPDLSISNLIILILTMTIIWGGILIGISLLIINNFDVFKQGRTVGWIGLLLFFNILGWAQLSHNPNLVWGMQIGLLFTIWLPILILTFGITLGIYLIFRDKALQLFALIMLTLVWLLVFYVRSHGAIQLLLDIIANNAPVLMFMLCLAQCIFILAPLSFIWHTLRLIHEEWTGKDIGQKDNC